MKGNKIASRYAQALLDLAVEQKLADRVNADMALFAGLNDESKELRNLLVSPIIPGSKKLAALNAIFLKDMDQLSINFITLIVKHSRESLLGEIADAYTGLYKVSKNILDVHVTSAAPLEKNVKEKILQKLKTKHTGEIILTEAVDESLVGGFVVKFDDKQLDASIASQLTNLRNLLLN